MLVLDTSLLVAYHNDRDSFHGPAAAMMAEIDAGAWGMGLVPDYVFAEFMTVVLARRGSERARAASRWLLDAAWTELVPCSPLFGDILARFHAQEGTRLSFTDIAVLEVAAEREAEHVATFDQEFRKMKGVKVVPA